MNSQIVVVGSLNADFVLPAERLPRAGETLLGGDLQVFPGGKGANQACAAASMCAKVRMIGQVGDDVFGRLLLESLERAGVDHSGVTRSVRPTGVASIYVLPNGENAILLSPGANGCLDPVSAERRLADLPQRSVLLCQLEIPMPAVLASLRVAARREAISILDPAPAQVLPQEALRLAHFLTPNQTEAVYLIGRPEQPPRTFSDAAAVCRELHTLGARRVVLKMGALGCFVSTGDEVFSVPALRVEPVDTTAAGDTFNGAFAASLAEGQPLRTAIAFANAAAAISVTRRGAQSSIPARTEVDQLLASAVTSQQP